MIIIATEIHLRSFWHFFQFAALAGTSTKQARRSAGCIHTAVGNKGWRIGYTITAWENLETMLQFRNTGAHKKAMQKTADVSYQYKTLRWEADQIPGWKEAKSRLDEIPFKVLK
jgi:hypothetical protein